MKMKKLFLIVVALLLILSIFLPSIPIYASNETQIDNPVDTTTKESYCYLDFDDFVLYEDNFICNAVYSFNEIPDIISSGNVEYEILEKNSRFTRIKVFLPNNDGTLSLKFIFDYEIRELFVFSSKRNDEYGVSSISFDTAKRLVNNLYNQELMDNDENPAIYSPRFKKSSKKVEQNRNYTGSGRVYGQLKWTDYNGSIHPLVGIKVKLTFSDSYNSVFQYTDSNGYYDISFSNIVGYTNYKCTLHIYTVNDYVVVKDNLNNIYEYVEVLPTSNNSTYQYNHTFDRFTAFYNENGSAISQPIFINGAVQIYEAMYYYSNYAINLSGDTNLPKCSVYYPVGNKHNSDEKLTNCYYDNANSIYLCSESNRVKTMCNCKNAECDCFNGGKCNCINELCDCPSDISCVTPYVSGSWDVIGHEYGHHLQKNYFQQSVAGTHNVNLNDIYAYMRNKSYNNPISDWQLFSAKVYGCALGMKEGWPTFFAISAQQSFSDDVKIIPTVGDNYYQSYNGVLYDLTSTSNKYYKANTPICNGESDEIIIMSFLYRIWENDNLESWDNISINDEVLWSIMLNNPTNLSEFINCLLAETTINISDVDLGELLSVFSLAPNNIELSLIDSNYQISFNRGNENVAYPMKNPECIYQFNNNEFYIEFYDDNDNLITNQYFDLGQTEISNDFTYVLSNNSWNRILDIQTLGYYVKITAYAKRTYTVLGETVTHKTGPYIAYERFIKPTNYSITLNDSRYYEKAVTIPVGGSFVFNVTDNIGGYKLFQTFGNMNAEMELYNSSGVLLASSKNDGFSNNPLIYYNISANTNYIINVNLEDKTATGLVKLSIIPCRGDLNSNSTTIENESDIYYHNSNSNYNTYVPQYESTVIRWKPAKTGYYALVLMSNFDSYLYVINPESPDVLIGDVDYNDDFVYDEDNNLYDEDSTLYGHYEANKTYLIVIGKKYIDEPGANISIRFDFFFAG